MGTKAAVLSELPTPSGRSVVAPEPLERGLAPQVLIADRNPASRAAREQQLRAGGFRVSVARTGFEAIVKACCHVPDLILIDESLAEGDIETAEVSRLLTTCPVTSHIPIVRLGRRNRMPQRLLNDLRRRAAVA